MTGRLRALAAAVALAATPAGAVQPDEILPDPALEARARAISAELRCVVCQNQSVDDSDAPLARDLRLLVRDRLRAGDGDAAVKDYVAARYGSFVLLKPPLRAGTLVLWFGPALLSIAALCGLLGRRRAASNPAALSAEERARVEALVGDGRS